MYLSKLRLYGFKSFSNKVEINFPKDGIISVVGPNGCGKSNIVDAIRWVLGEQKVKALRSSKMEDVIFSGTISMPPMHMAEVSLIIENNKGVLPSDYTQIMITRQSYRNGDSVYLLNNQPCRLKDIHHLFYDTGMGASSYSLMEQRMIDSVLSEKDEERRVLFEEACGISKYKKQRAETRRQLERTAASLARVEDNLRNTKQNVGIYERQARKAERWRELQAEVKALELSYQSDCYKLIKNRFDELNSRLEKQRREMEKIESAIAQNETVLVEKKLKLTADESRLAEFNQKVSDANAEGVRLTNRVQRLKDRIAYLEESIRKKEKDSKLASRKILEYCEERARLKNKLENTRSRKGNLKMQIESAKTQQAEHNQTYETCRSTLQSLSTERFAVFELLSQVRAEIEKFRSRAALNSQQLVEMDESLDALTEEENKLSEAFNALSGESRTLDANLRRDKSEQESCAEEKFRLSAEKTNLEKQFRALDNEKASLETRCSLLKSMQASQDGLGKGTRALLNHKKESIKGALFELIKVPEPYVQRVQLCLSELLQTLVVLPGTDPMPLVHFLRESEDGRVSLFSNRESLPFQRQRPGISGGQGFQGWIIDKIDAEPFLKGLLEYCLGHCALVDNIQNAQSICRDVRDADIWCICGNGDMVHSSGVIKGGQDAGRDSGLLIRKQELEKAGARLREVESAHARAATGIQDIKTKQTKLQVRETDLLNKIRQGEMQLRVSAERLENFQSSLSSTSMKKAGFAEKKALLLAASENLKTSTAPRETELARLEKEAAEIENRFVEAQEAVEAAEVKKADLDGNIHRLVNAETEARVKLENINQRLELLVDAESEQSSLQMRLDLDGQEWLTEIQQNQDNITELSISLHEINGDLELKTQRRDEAKKVYDVKMAGLEDIRNVIRNLNSEFHRSAGLLKDSEVEIEKITAKLRNIQERMFERYEVDFEKPECEFETREYNAETVSGELAGMKEKLKRMGPVSVDSLENYEEEKAKLEDVQKQFDDLDKARIGLERAIRKLDKIARQKFLEVFAEIQKNFQEVFTTLFEGGQVMLNLEEGVDPLDAKIEINASPLGKKMRGVTLLSGGERALTAISLLFALYLVRPSPYCIMDEVDGPLDDANISRFIKLLRRFSDKTQFVIVTHNKRSMAASDMLYGVTQEVKGISQLASVRLDEAALIAA